VRTLRKIALWLSTGAAITFLLLAALLRLTWRTVDIYIHDRYMPIQPAQLLLISLILFTAAFVIWKIKPPP
jgi:hypothetical protein